MPPVQTDASMETTLAAIVAHPTRARAFSILAERVASPVEIAQEIGKDVGHVGYHVRKLQQLNMIELVDERPVRGAVEHFYRAIERPVLSENEITEMTLEERENFARYAVQLLVADIARSLDQHTFNERPSSTIVRVPLLVDEDGYQELSDLHQEMLDRTLEIQATSAERMTNSGEAGIQAVSASMHFATPPRRRPAD